MATEKFEKNHESEDNKASSVKPDKETLNTTDPQEHMHGPLSSLMQGAEDAFSSKKSEDSDDEK